VTQSSPLNPVNRFVARGKLRITISDTGQQESGELRSFSQFSARKKTIDRIQPSAKSQLELKPPSQKCYEKHVFPSVAVLYLV
jgi:hypothetical protein